MFDDRNIGGSAVRIVQARAEYIMSLMPRLRKRISERIALPAQTSESLVTVGQMHLLFDLEHGPATMGELAQRAHVTLSTMTEAVNRLVKQGLVERLSDARDRRVVRIQFSVKGRERYHRLRIQMRRHFTALLSTMTESQQRRFISAFKTIESIILPRTPLGRRRKSESLAR